MAVRRRNKASRQRRSVGLVASGPSSSAPVLTLSVHTAKALFQHPGDTFWPTVLRKYTAFFQFAKSSCGPDVAREPYV